MRVKLFGIFENPFHVHNTEVSATTVTLVATGNQLYNLFRAVWQDSDFLQRENRETVRRDRGNDDDNDDDAEINKHPVTRRRNSPTVSSSALLRDHSFSSHIESWP